MKFDTFKQFFEWRKIWAPKLVLIKTKNGFNLNGMEIVIG